MPGLPKLKIVKATKRIFMELNDKKTSPVKTNEEIKKIKNAARNGISNALTDFSKPIHDSNEV